MEVKRVRKSSLSSQPSWESTTSHPATVPLPDVWTAFTPCPLSGRNQHAYVQRVRLIRLAVSSVIHGVNLRQRVCVQHACSAGRAWCVGSQMPETTPMLEGTFLYAHPLRVVRAGVLRDRGGAYMSHRWWPW